MILKASQRAGAKQLAAHILKGKENEHIEIHEVSGFMSSKAEDAFKEMYAVSQGTRCKQFMFSLILSPPAQESVSIDIYEKALSDVEKKLGMEGQPRVVVFHEKEGRRHAHCVWSRIDSEKMKAIDLPFFGLKLRDISKEIYLENGWSLPKGYVDSKERDPFNFTLAEWQQAKRINESPKSIKETFRECWSISDNRQSFIKALEARGYYLAQGDRRGYVAVDYRGEVYSLSRQIGVKAKDLQSRLGKPDELPAVDDIKAMLSQRLTQSLEDHKSQAIEHMRREAIPITQDRAAMTTQHKEERQKLQALQETRWKKEEAARFKRLPKGLMGVWHRLTGKYQRVRIQNEQETKDCLLRDRNQQQALIDRQLEERRALQQRIVSLRQKHRQDMQYLREDIAHYLKIGQATTEQTEKQKGNTRETGRAKSRTRTNTREI